MPTLTNRRLNAEERHEAMRALIAWFESQDINCQESSIVMIDLLSRAFIDKSRDPINLQKAVEYTRMALIYNIALLLKSGAGSHD